jgi:2-methylisocitrate lyase-like PEP mutase family enzyme
MNEQQKLKAEALRSLHHRERALVLANAWDVASARVLESAGAEAIATTSAGVAFSLGYLDGQTISRDEMLQVIARICRAVQLPVTADVEAGYGNRPEDAAETARRVMGAGAVGVNLEDRSGDRASPLLDIDLAARKVAAVRRAGDTAGVPLVINARTDVYLSEVGPPETRFDEALRRAMAYRHAGADCIFLPSVQDPETIRRFVQELRCPINILAGPGFPSIQELRKLGVARVSLGSKAMLASVTTVRHIWQELQTAGTYTSLEGALTYRDLSQLLAHS